MGCLGYFPSCANTDLIKSADDMNTAFISPILIFTIGPYCV